MSFTKTGTGLKPTGSVSGLKLAASPFTTPPDEEVAVADIYQLNNPGVINSIQDDTAAPQSFFDKIKNAVSAGFGSIGRALSKLTGVGQQSLPNVPGMPGVPGLPNQSSQGGFRGLQGGINALRQITNVASRAASAVNMMKKGGIMGKVSGLAALGGLGGIQGANQMGVASRNAIYGAQQGGLSGALMAAGALAGNQGGSLNALAYNVTALQRSGSYLKRASAGGDAVSALNAVDSSLAMTSATLGNLDKASRADFESGFSSVFISPQSTSDAYNKSARSRVRSAASDYSVSYSSDGSTPSATRAGTVAGLAIVGAGYGDNSIYSLARSEGLDDESAFIAGTALTTYGAKTGNVDIMMDMCKDPVGIKAVGSNPKALSHAVANLVPTEGQSKKPLASVYDDLVTLGNTTGQNWHKSSRSGATILDVSNVRSSPYALDVIHGKANADNLSLRRSQTEIAATAATLSEAQTLSAAASFSKPSVQSLQDENPSLSTSEASMLVNDLA